MLAVALHNLGVLTKLFSEAVEAIDAGVYKPGDRLVESELAERFGVSERTIYRDLNRLGDVIEPGANGVYQLARHHRSSLSPADLQTFAREAPIALAPERRAMETARQATHTPEPLALKSA